MSFSGNQAWQDGLAAIRANRAVLVPVAGVFFLLPGLVSVWFMSDFQMAVIENLRNPAAAEKALEAMGAAPMLIGLLTFVWQMAGFMALLALFTDNRRPTVGEAIGTGLACLPSLVAAFILFMLGFVLAMTVVLGMVGVIAAAVPFLGVVLVPLALAAMCYVPVKLSLTMPVIVIDGVRNPVAAMIRAWRLTRGASLRLLGFYLLLFIGYVVITMAVVAVFGSVIGLGSLAAGGSAPGSIPLIAMGLVSGIIGAAVNLLFTGILAAIHRQLAGPSSGAIADTFG